MAIGFVTHDGNEPGPSDGTVLRIPRPGNTVDLPSPTGKDKAFLQFMEKEESALDVQMTSDDEDMPAQASHISPSTFRAMAAGCTRWDMQDLEQATAGEVSLASFLAPLFSALPRSLSSC
jgi:hypothetical protein